MDIVMQKDNTIPQRAKAFASDGFTMAHRLFPFSEIAGTLIWNKVLFRLLNGQGTLIWNWLKGQERFLPRRIIKLVLCSDKCLNRFGDDVEK
ncbi:hypothetical protein AVEN_251584-1 [Araneus ventricosus]|uniref:Uncharacterized protein n=1 Tax=Araneus ventricosus TaxID=182803 RepID=A0A4Y2W3B6_ARAVE|nr:hypothetical protein AVEN_251584-1 [Araneus ventricosus]